MKYFIILSFIFCFGCTSDTLRGVLSESSATELKNVDSVIVDYSTLRKSFILDDYIINDYVDFEKAMKEIAPGGVIQCNPATTYLFKRSILVTKPITIIGYSTCVNKSTIWKFPVDSAGISFLRKFNSSGSRIQGIYFDGGHKKDVKNDNHGLYTQVRVDLKDCVFEAFPGHGVFLDGTSRISETSNVNRNMIESCRFSRNSKDGLHIEGNDANVCVIMNCDASNNEGTGFFDASMTGNIYIAPHTNNNGFAKGKVTHNCIRWYAITDSVPPNIEPGTNKVYWDTLLAAKDGHCIKPINEFPKWEPSKSYSSAKSFLTLKNGRGLLLLPYSEDNQVPAMFPGSVMILNGSFRVDDISKVQHLKQSTNGITENTQPLRKFK